MSTFISCLSYIYAIPSCKVITQLRSNNLPLLILFLFRRGELIFFFIFAILDSTVCGTGSCSGLCKGNTWTCFWTSLVSHWCDNRVNQGQKKTVKQETRRYFGIVPKQWKIKGHDYFSYIILQSQCTVLQDIFTSIFTAEYQKAMAKDQCISLQMFYYDKYKR